MENAVNDKDVDQLSQNYKGMNATGKEKVIKVANRFLSIWNITHERKSASPSKKCAKFNDG
jgi:hypothetical protein